MQAVRVARAAGCLSALLGVLSGCELEEITLVDAEDVVVAEVYLNVAADPADNEIRAFLHHTVGTVDSIADLQRARVSVERSDGKVYVLEPEGVDACGS